MEGSKIMKLLSFSTTLLIALISFVQISTANDKASCPANFEQKLTGNKNLDRLLNEKFSTSSENKNQLSTQKPVLDLVAKLSLISMAQPGDKLRIALKNVNNSDVFYYVAYLLLLKANNGVNVEVVVQANQTNPNSLLLNHVIQSPNIFVYINPESKETSATINVKQNPHQIRYDIVELVRKDGETFSVRSNNSLKWAPKDVIKIDANSRSFETHGDAAFVSVSTEFALRSSLSFSFDLLSDKTLAQKDPNFKLTQNGIDQFYNKVQAFAAKLRVNIPRGFKRQQAPMIFEVNGIHQPVDTYAKDEMASTALDFIEYISLK